MKNVVLYAVAGAALLLSVLSLVINKKKIGYVRSGYILENFTGMTEANAMVEQEAKKYRMAIDSLEKRYIQLRSNPPVELRNNKEELAYQLGLAQSELENYNKSATERLSAIQSELGDKVIKEINSFISEYGEEHGYDYILGTTTDGSILYGREGDDLTSVVLEALNARKK